MINVQVEKQPILDRYIPAHPVDRYTFKKWNTDDWFRHNENKFFQSEQDRGQAENTREEAKQLIQSSQNKTNSTQSEVTERLGERLQNINLWKFELEKTIRDMVRINTDQLWDLSFPSSVLLINSQKPHSSILIFKFNLTLQNLTPT